MVYVNEIRELARGGAVEIIADGQLLARVRKRDFERLPARAGEELDEREYLGGIARLQEGAAYECALSALDMAAKTESELKRKLAQKGFVAEAVDNAIERLKRARLIDDKALASRVVESAAGKQTGLYALKRKLKSRGISDADAEGALDTIDEAQQISACRAAAEKISKRYAELPARERNAKLTQALARRGYAWDVISAAVNTSDNDEYD